MKNQYRYENEIRRHVEDNVIGYYDINEWIETEENQYVVTLYEEGIKELYEKTTYTEESVVEYCYCPLCDSYFRASEYLKENIEDDKVRWLANFVTHYRHEHTKWDRTWGRGGYGWNKLSESTYDEAKKLQNNRAKRQLLRKAASFLNFWGFTPEDFEQLMSTDEATMELAAKKLSLSEQLEETCL